MIRKHIYYSGMVQGVGFRFTALRAARSYPVTGYVRNMPDGRVEMVVEGSSGDIEGMKNDIAGQLAGYIKGVDEGESAATGEFDQFTIRL